MSILDNSDKIMSFRGEAAKNFFRAYFRQNRAFSSLFEPFKAKFHTFFLIILCIYTEQRLIQNLKIIKKHTYEVLIDNTNLNVGLTFGSYQILKFVQRSHYWSLSSTH